MLRFMSQVALYLKDYLIQLDTSRHVILVSAHPCRPKPVS